MRLVFSFQFSVVSAAKWLRHFAASAKRKLCTENYALKTNSGFSLVEILVSLSLFIIVLTMAVGSLLVLISANAKAQNIQAAVGNVQFALDSMTREIRTGYAYYCSTNVSTNITGSFDQTSDCNKGAYLSIIEGGKSLTGDNTSNSRLAYRYNSTTKAIERKIGTGSWYSLTDPSVSIDQMHFNVSGTTEHSVDGSTVQPNVTIYIVGSVAGVEDTDTTFTMQTTVTKRVIDL